jgi:hypothetical protein
MKKYAVASLYILFGFSAAAGMVLLFIFLMIKLKNL